LRNLVLVLALANLGVLAVLAWFDDEPVPSPGYQGPGITLLRELDPNTSNARSAAGVPQIAASLGAADAPVQSESGLESQSDENPVASEAAPLSAPTTAPTVAETAPEAAIAAEPIEITGTEFGRCVSIGPFPTETGADSAFATLVEAGFEPLRAVREVEVWDGYWVYIGQVGNLDSARSVQAELAADGLDETQIVSTVANGNVLSLGVFSEITRAGAQAERVNGLGYEATIADNLTTAETQWLDVTLTSDQSLALDVLQAPGQISRLELLDCEPAEDD
jgi:hypothetical protein